VSQKTIFLNRFQLPPLALSLLSQLSDLDRKMLRLLLDSEGSIPTHELSLKLDMPISTVQRRRKRLEDEYLIKHYSLDPMKFGYRLIDLLIYTEGGETMNIGKKLLEREEVTYAARTIGEHTIDLRVEVFVKDNGVLLDLLESVKAMKGVRDVVWTEVIETIGRKNPPNHIVI
jgi:DNA-binding Lrp family transcriptional regulator